jgi:CBS domain containing-hemolysin-like protein
LAWRAAKADAEPKLIFAMTSLTAVLDLIVFNKVGSPQFMGWLAVPIIAVVIFNLDGWRVPVVSGLALAATTYLIYPVFYLDLMGLGWLSIGLLTIRNLGLIALLAWANYRLGKLAKANGQEFEPMPLTAQ